MSEKFDTAREQFLAEFVQLKADACYVREYRNYYNHWVTGLGVARTITSVGSIAGWLTRTHLAWLWAALLLAVQLSEALQKNFPVAKKRLALSKWCRALDSLVVTAQDTWDKIDSGTLHEAGIWKEISKMRAKKLAAQNRAVPNGLPKRRKLFDEAQRETVQFFKQKYGARIEG